jgi:hypothetical protein
MTVASFNLARLRRVELAQLGAALTLAVAIFLPWYSTNPAVPSATVGGHRGDVTAWLAEPVLRWLLLAAVGAALLSAWQTAAGETGTRGVHRGETSTVVAVLVLVLVLFVGIIDRPGSPNSEISLSVGWYLAALASVAAVAAAAARLPKPGRRPPGV